MGSKDMGRQRFRHAASALHSMHVDVSDQTMYHGARMLSFGLDRVFAQSCLVTLFISDFFVGNFD